MHLHEFSFSIFLFSFFSFHTCFFEEEGDEGLKSIMPQLYFKPAPNAHDTEIKCTKILEFQNSIDLLKATYGTDALGTFLKIVLKTSFDNFSQSPMTC